MSRLFCVRLICAVLAASLASSVSAQGPSGNGSVYSPLNTQQLFGAPEGQLWDTYTEWTVRPGSTRSLGDGLLFVPVHQSDETLLFADIRGNLDDLGNGTASWGGCLRTMVNDSWICGFYGFYDLTRSEHQNNFNQAMFGVEAMSVEWEGRLNGYFPEMDSHDINGSGMQPYAYYNGQTIRVRSQREAQQRALMGFDAEVGKLLHDWDDGDLELRGFAGAYHFATHATGCPNLSGPRGRLELRMYDLDWFGNGSRLVLGGELMWDQVRDTSGVASVQLRIPLGHDSRHKLTRFQRRMVDPIRRESNVLLCQDQPHSVVDELAIDPETNQPFGPVNVINRNTPLILENISDFGGNVFFVDGQYVIADGRQGPIILPHPLLLEPGQTLRGAGFQVRGAQTGQTAVFGTRPTFIGTNPARNVLVTFSGSTLRGVNVVGGLNGIGSGVNDFGLAASNITVTDNFVTGSIDDGFDFRSVDSGIFRNNVAQGNGDDGFDFSEEFAGIFSGNRAISNDDDGFEFSGDIEGDVLNNVASDNGDNGFQMNNIAATGRFIGNQALGNGDDGFEFFINGGTIQNNLAQQNLDDGYDFFRNNGVMTDNRAFTNGDDGFVFDRNNETFSSNIAAANVEDGFEFITNVVAGTMNQNAAINNGAFGFDFLTQLGTATGNVASGNVLDNSVPN